MGSSRLGNIGNTATPVQTERRLAQRQDLTLCLQTSRPHLGNCRRPSSRLGAPADSSA